MKDDFKYTLVCIEDICFFRVAASECCQYICIVLIFFNSNFIFE